MSIETAEKAVTRHPKIFAPGDGQSMNVFGVQVDVLVTGEDNGGTHCTYACIVAPGDGPPPHVHAQEDEEFFILEGEFEVLCGDQVHQARPGAFLYVPQGVPHTFKNVGQTTGRLLGIALPAGHEHFFADADRLARSGSLTPEAAVAVCRKHGMELLV